MFMKPWWQLTEQHIRLNLLGILFLPEIVSIWNSHHALINMNFGLVLYIKLANRQSERKPAFSSVFVQNHSKNDFEIDHHSLSHGAHVQPSVAKLVDCTDCKTNWNAVTCATMQWQAICWGCPVRLTFIVPLYNNTISVLYCFGNKMKIGFLLLFVNKKNISCFRKM